MKLRLFRAGSWLALFAVLAAFLFSAAVTASDGQGALIFAVTYPLMLALLSLSAFLSRRRFRVEYRLTLGGFAFLGAFVLFSFIPGLNLLPSGVVGGVASAYKLVFGITPYEAARRRRVDFGALLVKSLEAQDGKVLDLRGLHLPLEWKRICLFEPYTDDKRAVEISGVPPDWPLSLYSKVGQNDGVTAITLVGDRYPYPFRTWPQQRDSPECVRSLFERTRLVRERPRRPLRASSAPSHSYAAHPSR